MNWYRGVYTCGEPPRDQGYDLLYLQPVVATWLNTRIEYWLLFWSTCTTTCTCYLIEHQNWVLLLFGSLALWSNSISVSDGGGWQDIQVNQNTPHLFIRWNICLEISFYKEPLQVSGELSEDIEVYQSTPTFYITRWHLTYSVSFRKSWGNWTGHRISSRPAFIRRRHLTSSLISVLPHWVNIMTQDIWVHQITPS